MYPCEHTHKGSLALALLQLSLFPPHLTLVIPLSHSFISSLLHPSLACCPLGPVSGIMSPFRTKSSQMLIRLNHSFMMVGMRKQCGGGKQTLRGSGEKETGSSMSVCQVLFSPLTPSYPQGLIGSASRYYHPHIFLLILQQSSFPETPSLSPPHPPPGMLPVFPSSPFLRDTPIPPPVLSLGYSSYPTLHNGETTWSGHTQKTRGRQGRAQWTIESAVDQ